MERITITITKEAYSLLEQHRKQYYPQYKKISRMMLDMSMDEIREKANNKNEQ